MTPKWYCDILPLSLAADNGMSGPVIRGRMLGILHGLFVATPNTYAIALPPRKIMASNDVFRGSLRLFASGRDDLDRMVKEAGANPWFRDYVRFAYPVEVPADFAGQWTGFCRYRVPSIRQDRHEGDEKGQLRSRRMETAHDKHMEYFILASSSNRQRFTLYVETVEGKAPAGDCLPNGYGLSVPSRLFCLPEMPWV